MDVGSLEKEKRGGIKKISLKLGEKKGETKFRDVFLRDSDSSTNSERKSLLNPLSSSGRGGRVVSCGKK